MYLNRKRLLILFVSFLYKSIKCHIKPYAFIRPISLISNNFYTYNCLSPAASFRKALRACRLYHFIGGQDYFKCVFPKDFPRCYLCAMFIYTSHGHFSFTNDAMLSLKIAFSFRLIRSYICFCRVSAALNLAIFLYCCSNLYFVFIFSYQNSRRPLDFVCLLLCGCLGARGGL